MSYPPLSEYGSYYDSTSGQAGNTAYSSARQSEGSSYSHHYSSDNRQPQYPSSSDYHWNAQGHQGYSSESPQSYDAWREANAQSAHYDYRREAGSYATRAAANIGKHYRGSGLGPTQTASSVTEWNSLAPTYGLENQRPASRARQPSSKYSPIAASRVPNRAQSPTQHWHASGNQQQHTYPVRNAAANTTREMTLTTASRNLETASQNLVISAAQALAGAVSLSNLSTEASQQSPSPAMSSAKAAGQSHSLYPAPRAPSAHSQRNSASSAINTLSGPETATEPSASQTGTKHGHKPSQPKQPAASQSNSVSSLLSPTQKAAAPGSSTAAMPTYIDPTKVFNPYHREHERRRKEAAEAEAQAQAQARKATEDAATARQARESQAQAKTQAAKSRESDSAAIAAPTAAITPADEEDEMAAEMKVMMEKMKAFRQKDPSMFQKLWEDMRKPVASNNAPGNTQSTSPQLSQRQRQRQSTAPSTAPLASPAAPVPESPLTSVSVSQGTKTREPRPVPHAASTFPYAPANGYKVVVENNGEGLPDLGRFPAERRIRASQAVRNMSSGASQIPAASPGAIPKPGLCNNRSPATLPGQVPGPLPAKTVSGGVEWPRDKRDALAKAAIEALNSVPENAGVEITTDEIHAMLDLNPSYIQLCDLLANKGLKFHRGHFARQLLTSVPDLTTPQKAKHPPPIPKKANAVNATPKTIGSPSVPLMDPNGYPLLHYGGPYLPPGHTGQPNGHPSGVLYGNGLPNRIQGRNMLAHVKPEFTKTVSKPKKSSLLSVKPEPPPGSKEAMARKRNFSELIDLTQLDDNDDYVLSNKHLRTDSPSPRPNPLEKYQLQANVQSPLNSINLDQGTPLKFNPVQIHSAPPPAPPSPGPPNKTILARPVDKGEALRKSYYDPKTVARDILIAAGRHPHERPLNAHMASLLGKHIELDSDLNSFDWDAIDPGGPPIPRVGYIDIPAAPPRFHLGQRTGRETQRVRHQPKDEAKKPRLPDSEERDSAGGAPAHAPPGPQFSKERFAKRYYSGRGRPPRDAIRGPRPPRLHESQVVDDVRPSTNALTPQQHRGLTLDSAKLSSGGRSLRSSSRQLHENMESETPTGAFYPSGKRRGRPPGSKNKHTSVAAMKKFAAPLPQVEIEIPSSLKGKSGFRCRWRRCKVELHNLDTLRKHIARVHRPTEAEIKEGALFCWWKDCQYLQADEEGNIEPTHAFTTLEEWREHINEDHLHKVAMKLGDGPNTSQIGKTMPLSFNVSRFRYESPLSVEANARTGSYADSQTLALNKARYLADKEGRFTTPAVTTRSNHELPQDTMTFSNPVGDEGEIKAQKAFMKAHRPGEKIGSKNEAEETLRAIEARKAKIGPGIDRGGCTLVNEARRATLVQNPGIRRVVDADF